MLNAKAEGGKMGKEELRKETIKLREAVVPKLWEGETWGT